MEALSNLIIKFAKRTPYFHLEGYMNRWWLLKPRKWLPISARVHEIIRSDDDRALHDHPWSYVSIILRGGYWEHTPDGKRKYYGAGSILYRPYTSIHRLEIPEGTTATTLFIMGPYKQGWGFHTPEGKIPWREYIGEEAAQEAEQELKQHYAHDPRRYQA
jgi:hypothetical protein